MLHDSPPLLNATGLPELNHIDGKQHGKGDDEHDQGDGRSAGIVDVIKLLHDDVRDDLSVVLGTVAGNVNDSAQINIAQQPWNQIMCLVASDAASERLYTFKINGNVINTIKIVIVIPMCVSRISFLL